MEELSIVYYNLLEIKRLSNGAGFITVEIPYGSSVKDRNSILSKAWKNLMESNNNELVFHAVGNPGNPLFIKSLNSFLEDSDLLAIQSENTNRMNSIKSADRTLHLSESSSLPRA